MFHFAKPWGGLRFLTRVKVFCRFNSEFQWNSTLYGPGIFGTGYTSTHTEVNIQKTNYTLRRLAFSFSRFDDWTGLLSSSFSRHATCPAIIPLHILSTLLLLWNYLNIGLLDYNRIIWDSEVLVRRINPYGFSDDWQLSTTPNPCNIMNTRNYLSPN